MPTHTSHSVVSFKARFMLRGFEAPQPPGAYRVERDDEAIEGATWLAWRRIATFIHLPAIGVANGASQMLEIDPDELDAALRKDVEAA
ncbi:MAG: hypothetical protein K5872_04695 [Rhizobiaceae bacterium]|nr:hypothetical protein [Rhizobiaceae bacterium]MCV0405508.1 hypothetical protein [Rhizobiaceae bacterium]